MIGTKIQLRFSDFDMGGHVHNAAYLNYFESARIHFFIETIGVDWDWKKHGLIIKKNVIEYHIPTFIEDEMKVEVTCTSIGTKSFTLAYAVKDAMNNLKANGESVVVCFDYTLHQTIEIPETMRQGLELHLTA